MLTCEDLCVGYEGTAIVSHLQFTIHKGDYVCIVGENGSGKSTLMKTILGLLPPISGRIRMDEEFAATGIGYLPQQTAVQKDFPASVREIVLSGCQTGQSLHPFYSKEEKMRAEKAMEKLQISHLRHQCYRELSGGQQQKVLLARALCAAHSLLMMDEPVTGLDPGATAEFYQIIAALNREEQMTILMISHDIRTALPYASHILYVGQTFFFGSAEEFQNSALGKRYTRKEQSL